MRQIIDFAIELDPNMVLFDIITPFPGNQLYNWAKEKEYLKTENRLDYDLYTPVMKLPTVSEDMIMEYHRRAHKTFYLRFEHLLKHLLNTRSLFDLQQNVKTFISILIK